MPRHKFGIENIDGRPYSLAPGAVAARERRARGGRATAAHGRLSEYSVYGCRCFECREVHRVNHLVYMGRSPGQVAAHRERAMRRSRPEGR